MNHTGYIYGPMARERRKTADRIARAMVNRYTLALVVLAFLLGAMHADHTALMAGIIH